MAEESVATRDSLGAGEMSRCMREGPSNVLTRLTPVGRDEYPPGEYESCEFEGEMLRDDSRGMVMRGCSGMGSSSVGLNRSL
jgi:hypothetical protein